MCSTSDDDQRCIFHAQPRDPNFGNDEKMAYSLVDGTLSSLRAMYGVKHTDAAVGAYVEGAPQPLFNGADSIALTDTFNGVTLTATSQEVVSGTAALPGKPALTGDRDRVENEVTSTPVYEPEKSQHIEKMIAFRRVEKLDLGLTL